MHDEPRLTHFDHQGQTRMVDISNKGSTVRVARAAAKIQMQPATAERIRQRDFAKGDVIQVARLAGIMAAKKTHDLIPLCHAVSIAGIELDDEFVQPDLLKLTATVTTVGATGVEMEALTAVSLAALTVYDMCKAIDRGMTITSIALEHKSGGKSGDWNQE